VSNRAILVVAALVLVVGLAGAFAIPPGTCPQGRELVEDLVEPGTYRCRVLYDVFTPARSLIVLKYAIGIGSVLAAAALAVGVLVRHRRGMSST
jgi:hypothetical protein